MQQFMHQFMQRPAEIRKRRITPDLGLDVDREAFREKSVAVREEDMNQFVRNGSLAGDDPPSWKFHVTGATRPGRHQGFRYPVAIGYDDV